MVKDNAGWALFAEKNSSTISIVGLVVAEIFVYSIKTNTLISVERSYVVEGIEKMSVVARPARCWIGSIDRWKEGRKTKNDTYIASIQYKLRRLH